MICYVGWNRLLSSLTFTVEEKDLVIKNSWLLLDLCCRQIKMSGHDLSPLLPHLRPCLPSCNNEGVRSYLSEERKAYYLFRFISADLFTVSNITFLCLNLSSSSKHRKPVKQVPSERATGGKKEKVINFLFYFLHSCFQRVVSYAVWWTLYRIFLFSLFICFCYDCRLLSNS